ncbi:hypothetical protein [Streptomyces sp. NPDC051561]|uniref:hypothetical protein n=1 Tax=Streptomyces sp. NPDC051561 TaxID=3365658 RepID=UPI00379DC82C
MHPLHFEPAQVTPAVDGTHAAGAAGVQVFHYLPGDESPVLRHWPGLYQDWPEDETPFTEWAVNNNNSEEVALYIGLVWHLTAGLARYAIPAYYRDEAQRTVGRTPTLIDWQYEVDAEQPTPALRARGFVPGRAAVPSSPRGTAWQRANSGRAGLFPLSTPRDLVSLLHAVIFDASSEITVFAVAPGSERLARLAAALRGPDRPELSDVLGDEGVCVDLTLGSDLGCDDSLIAASRTDLRPRLTALTTACAHRIQAYDQAVDKLVTVPEFLLAMRALAGVALDTP